MKNYLFSHILSGVTITINAQSLEGAKGILSKVVVNTSHWNEYR